MTSTQIRAILTALHLYDQLNDWLSLGQHRIWKQMAVKWSNVSPGDTCLDLCCGGGDLALRLVRQVGATGCVYGVDFSSKQGAKPSASFANATPEPPSIIWVEADVLDLPLLTLLRRRYNGLRSPECDRYSRSLTELHRVLKPGAKAAILDFHRPSNLQLRAFQQWYLDTIVVPVAQQLGLTEEYAYISPSLDRFHRAQSR